MTWSPPVNRGVSAHMGAQQGIPQAVFWPAVMLGAFSLSVAFITVRTLPRGVMAAFGLAVDIQAARPIAMLFLAFFLLLVCAFSLGIGFSIAVIRGNPQGWFGAAAMLYSPLAATAFSPEVSASFLRFSLVMSLMGTLLLLPAARAHCHVGDRLVPAAIFGILLVAVGFGAIEWGMYSYALSVPSQVEILR